MGDLMMTNRNSSYDYIVPIDGFNGTGLLSFQSKVVSLNDKVYKKKEKVVSPKYFYETPCSYREYSWKNKSFVRMMGDKEVTKRPLPNTAPLADPCSEILEPAKSGSTPSSTKWTIKMSAMELYQPLEETMEGFKEEQGEDSRSSPDSAKKVVRFEETPPPIISNRKEIADSFFNTRPTHDPNKTTTAHFSWPKKNFIKLNREVLRVKEKARAPSKKTKEREKVPDKPPAPPPRILQRTTNNRKSSRKYSKNKKRVYRDDNVFDYYSKMDTKVLREPATCIEKLMDHMSDFFQDAEINPREMIYNAEITETSVTDCVIEIKVEESEEVSEKNDMYTEELRAESYTESSSEDESESSVCESDQRPTFNCLEFPWQVRIYKSPKTGKLVGYSKKEPLLHRATRVYHPYFTYIVYQTVRYERVVITRRPAMSVSKREPSKTEKREPSKTDKREPSKTRSRQESRPRQGEGKSRLVMSNFEPKARDLMEYDVIVCATPQPEEEDTYSLDVNISPKNLTNKIHQHIEMISQMKFGLDKEFLKELDEGSPKTRSAFTISLEYEAKSLHDIGKYFICDHQASKGDFICAMNKIEQSTTLHTCTKEQTALLNTFFEYALNPIGRNLNSQFCHKYLVPKVKEYFQEHLLKLKQRMDQNFTLRFKRSIVAESQWSVCLLAALTIVFVLKIMEIYLTVFHN